MALPVTVAENCSVWPAPKLAEAGLTVTETGGGGTRVMVAMENLVGSMTETAVMVTVVSTAIEPGAVYSPDGVSEPTAGRSVQATPVLVLPVTVAKNASVWPTPKVAEAGLTVTETGGGGSRVMVAEENLVGSMTEAAVIVTVVSTAMEPGAVYSPDGVSVPVAGVKDHVTPGLFVPVTVAPNCCHCPWLKPAVSGAAVTEMGTRATLAVADFVASAAAVAVRTMVCWAGTIAGAV